MTQKLEFGVRNQLPQVWQLITSDIFLLFPLHKKREVKGQLGTKHLLCVTASNSQGCSDQDGVFLLKKARILQLK